MAFNWTDISDGEQMSSVRTKLNALGTEVGAIETAVNTSGSAVYAHGGASTAMTADVWTDMPNDHAGVLTYTDALPDGVTRLVDPLTGKLDISELSEGTSAVVEFEGTFTPGSGNTEVRARFVVGLIGGGTATIEVLVGTFKGTSARRLSLTKVFVITDKIDPSVPVDVQAIADTNSTMLVDSYNIVIHTGQVA